MAVEFITETTGKIYEGGSSTDVTFSNNTIVCDGDVLCGYSVYTLENNKVIIFDSDGHEVLTTNGAFGMDNSLLDGKTYNSTGTSGGTISFNEGKCARGKENRDYYVFNSFIILKFDEGENWFFVEADSLSDDLTTFVESASTRETYVLQ